MATIRAKVMNTLAYRAEDRLRLYVGAENDTQLGSAPRLLLEQSPWPDGANRVGFGTDRQGLGPFGLAGDGFGYGEGEFGFGSFGLNDMPRVALSARYVPKDKTAVLPIGVAVADAVGNESMALEQLIGLNDAPVGARNVSASAGDGPGSVTLTWDASPDVFEL